MVDWVCVFTDQFLLLRFSSLQQITVRLQRDIVGGFVGAAAHFIDSRSPENGSNILVPCIQHRLPRAHVAGPNSSIVDQSRRSPPRGI